jgi:methyltransferase
VRPARYGPIVALFGLQRIVELAISRRNEREIRHRDPQVREAGRLNFIALALANAALFSLPVLESTLRRGRKVAVPVQAIGWAGALTALGLRLSVIRTLAKEWNVRALVPADLHVVDSGPYRFIRHPNYVAVALEFACLPLIGGAYGCAVGLSTVNAILLRERIREEERLLLEIPAYQERMGRKPRFIPRFTTSVRSGEPATHVG